MQDYIKENLLSDEKILWTGRPGNLKLFEPAFMPGLIAKFMIGLLFAIGGIWYYIYASGSETQSMPTSAGWFMVAIGIIVAVMPVLDFKKLNTKCLYCLTTHRAIIAIKDNPFTLRFRMLDKVGDVSYQELSTGNGIVYVGERAKGDFKRASLMSTNPSAQEEPDAPLMFYSVKDPAVLCQYIKTIKGGEIIDAPASLRQQPSERAEKIA